MVYSKNAHVIVKKIRNCVIFLSLYFYKKKHPTHAAHAPGRLSGVFERRTVWICPAAAVSAPIGKTATIKNERVHGAGFRSFPNGGGLTTHRLKRQGNFPQSILPKTLPHSFSPESNYSCMKQENVINSRPLCTLETKAFLFASSEENSQPSVHYGSTVA